MDKKVILLFFVLFTVSCSPSASAKATIVAEAFAETSAALPTNTVTPTETPEPTRTQTITPSRTPTETATLPPLTLTAISQAATATERSGIATATQEAANNIRTATASAISAQKTEIASYSPVTRKELVNYPDSYKGEKIVIQGRIFNINGNTEVQIWMNDSYDAIYVIMADPFSGIYEGDYLTFYGTGNGETCFNNSYGAEVCQPILINAFFVKP